MNRTQELRRLLADHQPFHSEFQMDRFITTQHGGTRWGCYRQALREVRTRFDALKLDYIAIERTKLRISLLERGYGGRTDHEADFPDDAVEARRQLDLSEARLSLEGLEATAEDRCREFIRFFDQARALRRELGELTPARRAQLERELWEYRVKSEAATDWIRSGGLSASTLEAMRTLPPDMRARVWQAIRAESQEELTNWWLNYESELPALPDATTPEEVEALLCRSQLLPTSSG